MLKTYYYNSRLGLGGFMKLFKKAALILSSAAALLSVSGCGMASQVKITGTESGAIEEGTALVYNLDHKSYVHGQKVIDALRVLPSDILIKSSTKSKTGGKTEDWGVKLEYYTVSESDVEGVEEVLSPDVFKEGGEMATKELVAKCGDEESVIGLASKCEKIGSSDNTYGYTHFEIDPDWVDEHFLDMLSVGWYKMTIKLEEFKYTRPDASVGTSLSTKA